jgi:hypothetical protein
MDPRIIDGPRLRWLPSRPGPEQNGLMPIRAGDLVRKRQPKRRPRLIASWNSCCGFGTSGLFALGLVEICVHCLRLVDDAEARCEPNT